MGKKERKEHKLKIYYNMKGEPYFQFNGLRYYIKDLLLNGDRIITNYANCFSISYKFKILYDIEDYIILYDKKEIIL